MLENMITDRTLADVQRFLTLGNKGLNNMTAAELEEWNSDLKGAYNVSDLNRVGVALNYLRDRLKNAGYLKGNEFAAVTNWNEKNIPSTADFSAYLRAVETIRAAMSRYNTTPATPTDTGSLDYIGANAIEQILIDVDKLITNMQAARYYCSDIMSGEV